MIRGTFPWGSASASGSHLLAHAPNAAAVAPSASAIGASATAARPKRIDLVGGSTAFLIESHELPLVDIGISLRSGSADDRADKIGLSRLATRMLRRGAEGWSSDKIEDTIDLLGGEISADVSASTVSIHVQVIKRNLAPMMQLLRALLASPTFPEDELSRLRRETLAEIVEARDSDRALAGKFFREALFGDHAYGRGSTGTTKSVSSLTRADTVAWHRRHFVQGNVIVGVSGDVNEAELKSLIAPVFAALPSGAAPVDNVVDPVVPKGRRLVIIDKPARTQTQILIGGLGTHPLDDDHVPLHVANTIFGGTFTARLMKAIRSERGWSYGASSRLPIERRREGFSMWTFPAATDAAACVQLEIELLEKLVAEGITDEELAFAQSYLSESYAFDIDTPYKRVRQAVDEMLYGLPDDYHTGYVRHVRAVTRSQANEALKKRISLDDFVVVVVGTASELREPLSKAIPRLSAIEIIPFDRE